MELLFGSGPLPRRAAISFYPTSDTHGANAAFVITKRFGEVVKAMKANGITLDLNTYRYCTVKLCHILEGNVTAEGRAFLAHQTASSLICDLANNLGPDIMSPVLESEIVNGHWTRGCFSDVGIELLDRTAEETLRSQLLVMQTQLEKQQAIMTLQDVLIAQQAVRIAAQDILIAQQSEELKELRAQLKDLRSLVAELQKKV